MNFANGKRTLSLPRIFFISLLALTACLTVTRTLALLFAFDANIGYFRPGFLPVLTYVLEGLAIACCIALPFLIKKEGVCEQEPPLSTAGMVGACCCALVLAATALYLLITCTSVPAPLFLVLFAALFLAVGAAYFAMHLFPQRSPHVLLCYGMILGALTVLAIVYFDRYTQMNAPHKIALQCCMLSIMGALLLEARSALGRGDTATRAALTAFAALLCFFLGASGLIGFAAGAFDSMTYLLFDLCSLCLSVWFFAKCHGFFSKKEEQA